jgi:hypothetical protein
MALFAICTRIRPLINVALHHRCMRRPVYPRSIESNFGTAAPWLF